MKSMLIAAIAGLTLCFAGDFTSEAEARTWRRAHRHHHYGHHHGWYGGHRHYNYGYHRGHYHRHYYTPRSYYYYTPRTYYYPRYGSGWNGGSVWFGF